ncbi:MAG: SH3 domain-containing protein [Anaerolineales bacterium]|nr:SH3 domain-containing protein [Anaerolineales bacterium]
MRSWTKLFLVLTILAGAAGLFFFAPGSETVAAQQPTGSIATVTGTPSGPMITVTYPEQINVRAGPHSVYYPAVGVLLPGEQAPALGRSPGGEWIQIKYPGVQGGIGWVYAPLVGLSPGFLPIIEPPPTATPRTTPTIDPTLAAAFSIPTTPTRLPTFTPPPPLVIPTFSPAGSGGGSVPMGLVIFGMAFIGVFVAIIAFLRGR